MKSSRTFFLLSLGALVSTPAFAFPSDPCAVATATCKTITRTGTSADTGSFLAARATFQVSSELNGPGLDTLTITLSNISGGDIQSNPDVLTAVLFTLRDASSQIVSGLTPISALIAAGSDVVNNAGVTPSQPAGDNVGGEWGYRDAPASGGTTFSTFGFETGISSSGLGGWFGGANFNGPNLEDPIALNGLEYGLVGPGTVFGGANGWNPDEPMVKDTVQFKLRFTEGRQFNLAAVGALDAGFQYGTNPIEPLLPIPGTAWLIGLGVLCFPLVRRVNARAGHMPSGAAA